MSIYDKIGDLEFRHFQLTAEYNAALSDLVDGKYLDDKYRPVIDELREVEIELDHLYHVVGKWTESIDNRFNPN